MQPEKRINLMNALSQSFYTANALDPRSVLVAIPTFNEEAHIANTLHELLDNDVAMLSVKIVVADGGSTDRTCEIVTRLAERYPNLELIHNPDRIQAAAINRVVETCAEAHHEYLVRVDAHAKYPRGYVLRVAKALMVHDAAAVATVMDSVGDNCFQRGSAWAMETILGTGGSSHRGGHKSGYVDHGHHAGFRLDFWRQTGGYDTTFIANEDAELDYRLGMIGGKIWLDATIRLDYIMRATAMKLAKQYWNYGTGRAQTILHHKIQPRLRQMVPPVILLVNLFSILLATTFPMLILLPVSYVLILAGTALFLAAKHRCKCALMAAPALFIMHQCWGAGFLVYMLRNVRRWV